MAEKKKTKEEKIEIGVPVKLVWGQSDDIDTVYANHVLISHSGPEFYLIFGELCQPIITSEEDIPEEMEIKPKARIVISPTQMKEISDAIAGNVKKYLEKEKRDDSS